MAKQTPNAEQLKAIQTTEGPVLIIAGPGSGKTFTLVERVYHLLVNKKVEPENIFISTFTEKAAKELVTRISNKLYEEGVDINVNNLCIGTMHSIFLNLLEEFRDYTRLKRNYTMWDQFDQQYILYKNLWQFKEIDKEEVILGNGGWWGQAGNLLKQLNKISEEAIDCKDLENSDLPDIKTLGALHRRYEEFLEEQNAIDFSTIQLEFLRLIKNNPDVKEILKKTFPILYD